jgi:anti-sigma-K factor RskA
MKMKQMPYRVENGAIEQAKYRAKMAVREAAHPTEHTPYRVQWRWISAIAVAAVVVMGVFGIVKFRDDIFYQPTPMEELIAELQYAPDEVVNEWASDVDYYMEDVSSL